MGEEIVESRKVLVVEDFAEFRKFLCSLLQPTTEFRVELASDGLEAVQKAKELRPDLILLDIGLPDINGMEVARRVRMLGTSAKILFVSAESDPEVVREVLSLGSGYVHKPSVQTDLLPAIEAVLKGEQFVSRDLGLNERVEAPQSHKVQFYSDDSVLLESFARFIAMAFEAHSSAIVLATKSHRENLVQRLRAEGFDVDGAIQQGTLVSLDAGEMLLTIMARGEPDVVRFFDGLCRLIESAGKATKRENPRIAICGECVGLLCALGNTNAAIQLERAGNDLAQKYNVDILCAYPLSSFEGGEDNRRAFHSVCAEHTAVHSR